MGRDIRALALAGALVWIVVACATDPQPDPVRPTDDPYRLGEAARPVSQTLHLVIDPDRPDYSGTTTVELDVPRAIDRLRFHASDLTLSRVVLVGPHGPIDATRLPPDTSHTFTVLARRRICSKLPSVPACSPEN